MSGYIPLNDMMPLRVFLKARLVQQRGRLAMFAHYKNNPGAWFGGSDKDVAAIKRDIKECECALAALELKIPSDD